MPEEGAASVASDRALLVEVFEAALDGRKEDAEAGISVMSVREQDDLWRALAALLGTLHDDHGWGWPCNCEQGDTDV